MPGMGFMSNIQVIFFIIFAIIMAVNLLKFVATPYNAMVRARNNVEEKFASMDIFLKKRYDLIPNIVRVVKGYAKHEKETLQAVIEARNLAMNNADKKTKVDTENALSDNLTQLFALGESYPELKSDKHFLDLQVQLLKIEDEISGSRKEYNESVSAYNTMIQSFPMSLVAKIFRFGEKHFFRVSSASERSNIDIEL